MDKLTVAPDPLLTLLPCSSLEFQNPAYNTAGTSPGQDIPPSQDLGALDASPATTTKPSLAFGKSSPPLILHFCT